MKKIILILLLAKAIIASPAQFTVDGPCQVTFSPSGGTTDAIVVYINSSRKSIRILAYNFTSAPIAQALVQAHNRGVDVKVVLDRSAVKEKNSVLQTLLAANIPTWIDSRHNIAHNKVIIVDENKFETGSFNYTGNAERSNGENALICPSISGASIYLANWENHMNHSMRAE